MSKSIIILRVGASLCALDQASVREITHVVELAVPPGLPATLEGVLNIAGEAVLVIDLAKLMGRTPSAEVDPLYRHLVLLARGDGMALLVDRVEDVRALDGLTITPVSADASMNACIHGQIELDGAVIHLLAADRILLAVEQARLADLRVAEQARLDALEAT